MPDRRRVNYSLSDELVDRIEEEIPQGERSQFIEKAAWEKLED